MPRRLLVLLAAIGCLAALATVALGATKRITPKRVGGVKLGMKHSTAQARGLVGRLRKGCELSGPGARVARLRAPLEGEVSLTRQDPRRIRRIVVRGGATARGVGIGSTIAEIEEAFPKAKVDRATEELFGLTLVRVPKRGGGRIQFAVPVDSGKASIIGVPSIPFCE